MFGKMPPLQTVGSKNTGVEARYTKFNMARTKQEITDTLVSVFEDLCALNGQGVDRPAPRLIAQVVRMLEPQRGGLLLNQAKIKLRSNPKPAKAESPGKSPLDYQNEWKGPAETYIRPRTKVETPTIETPPEVGKPKGAQPVRPSQPHKAEPEQVPQPVAPKLEGEGQGESVAAVEPLTPDEISAMMELKPIDAEENYPAARVIITLLSVGVDSTTLENKTYRQLYNITRTHFA